jgi:hypothetical protein
MMGSILTVMKLDNELKQLVEPYACSKHAVDRANQCT